MKKVLSIWSWAMLLAMCVGISSCGGGSGGNSPSSKKSEYVGTWKWENEGTHELQVFNDGTVRYNPVRGTYEGRWELKSSSVGDHTFEWVEITVNSFGTILLKNDGSIYLKMPGASSLDTVRHLYGSGKQARKIK